MTARGPEKGPVFQGPVDWDSWPWATAKLGHAAARKGPASWVVSWKDGQGGLATAGTVRDHTLAPALEFPLFSLARVGVR